MKKTLLFGALIVFVIGSISAQQQIPNGGFETWDDPGYGYENPVDWQTPNESTLALSTFTVTKSDDAFAGNYSARLESILLAGVYKTPGVVTLGDFIVHLATFTATLEGGIPFTSRPLALKGNYKNYPTAGDVTMISVLFTKYNPSKGMRDTIGGGTMFFSETIDTWTSFSVPIQFSTADAPDTMNMFAVSSNMADLKVGSVMYLDNFSFEYPAGIGDVEQLVHTSIFPNPASNKVSFSFGKEVNGSLNIYSNDGQLVYSQTVNGAEYSADVSSFASGTYYFGLYEGSKKVSSGQFLINK